MNARAGHIGLPLLNTSMRAHKSRGHLTVKLPYFIRLKWLALLAGLAGILIVSRFAKAGVSAAAQSMPGRDSKPNIMLVVLDDVGYSDLGCYGGEIRTPNLDALAQGGVRYLKFDTNAVCSATRASLLTGRNSQTVKMGFLSAMSEQSVRGISGYARIMARKNPRWAPILGDESLKELSVVDPGWRDPKDQSPVRGWMPQNAESVATGLKLDGYATWAIGKWHLAPQWEDGLPGNNADFPLERGFDYFYGFRDGWTDQYRPILYLNNHRIPIPQYPYGKMLTGDLIDRAIGQMKAQRKRRPAQPFFLYLALPVAHAPVQVTQPYIDAYDGVYAKGWDAIRRARFSRQKKMGVIPEDAVLPRRNPGDPPWRTLTSQQKRVYSRFMQTYAGYITYGDEQLGRLFRYMRRTGIWKNTLVMVLSDNGPASEDKDGGFFRPYGDRTTLAEMDSHLNELGGPRTEPVYQRAWAMASATPYRRYKLWPYLGGVRDDLIISWPGHIKDLGSVRGQYVHAIDIAPTMLAAAGTRFESVLDGRKQIPVAGKSFLPSLGNPRAPSARTVQYFVLLGDRAITDKNWRAVAMHEPGTPFSQDRWELFNLADDPTEAVNLAKTDSTRLRRMQALWTSQARKFGGWPLAQSPFGIWETGFFSAFPAKERYDY